MIVALTVAACGVESTERPDPPDLPEPGEYQEAIVGVAGASIELGAARVVIPPGALAEDTTVRIAVVGNAAPAAFAAYSPVFSFEPAGLTFAEPIEVHLPYDGADDAATIFWTSHGTGSYVALPTAVSGGVATARVAHFSEAFVGSGCAGDDCCDRANGELDVLFMVDNSNSMSEEQEALASQLPRLARILATGDLDGDGVQDFPALSSVRVGVVTSDMGTGGFSIQTCEEPLHGDDGVLRSEGNLEVGGCAASYPAFAELGADDGPASVEEFVRHVECVSRAGTGGCGFEQPLEALLKAVTPSASPIEFFDGAGHADGANAGFVRDESLVAYVVVTDEGDCSAADPSLFDPSREDFGPLNTRCALRPDALHPVERYITGLRALRSDPDDVLFSIIAGVPVDLAGAGAGLDFDGILADDRMQDRVSPENPNELVPSCDTAIGRAYPPRRLVEVARGFGAGAVVHSICQPDFSPAIGAILERVAARARGECSE